jgi:pSer/pThr/pTyr-binding forkhead associated (FHA) protein
MKLSLLVMTPGKQQGKSLDIKTPQFLVGRDPQCQLRPASPLISKRHCAILIREGKAFIRDFDSTNGTFVNGDPVKGERELHHDDQLKIGPIEFTVRMDLVATPVNKATPAPATKPAARTPAPTTKDDTPAPVSKPAAASAEEDALMMLLDGDDSSAGGLSSEGGVPEGSTVMDLKVPPEVIAAADANKQGQSAKKDSHEGDTRSAAASILEKMMRRPRN